jgi:hypothetical protein
LHKAFKALAFKSENTSVSPIHRMGEKQGTFSSQPTSVSHDATKQGNKDA